MRFFYLLPPLMHRAPQYVLPTANSQKNPQFNIELHALFRTQPMHLHKCCLTILSLLHMQVAHLRKHHRMPKCTHTQEVTHSSYSSGNSLWKCQNPVGSTTLNRSGTLLECLNRSHKNDDAPHWVAVVTQGCFQDNKVSCLCSGCQFFNY